MRNVYDSSAVESTKPIQMHYLWFLVYSIYLDRHLILVFPYRTIVRAVFQVSCGIQEPFTCWFHQIKLHLNAALLPLGCFSFISEEIHRKALCSCQMFLPHCHFVGQHSWGMTFQAICKYYGLQKMHTETKLLHLKKKKRVDEGINIIFPTWKQFILHYNASGIFIMVRLTD